jgi:glucuronoarabinoxylan endo-1,4-beta-xylanase
LKNGGVSLYAIAVQNEPDYQVTYESCSFTPTEMLNFIKNYGARITGAKLIAGESFQYRTALTNPSLVSKMSFKCPGFNIQINNFFK